MGSILRGHLGEFLRVRASAQRAASPTGVLGAFCLLLLPLGGCTLLVKEELENAPVPCQSAADCFAGFACREGSCSEAEAPKEPPPAPPMTVGPAGGILLGPDGVRLVVPAGALDDDVALRVERAPTSVGAPDIALSSRIYQISPALVLDAPAHLEIPVDETSCPLGCAIFMEGADHAWTPLPASEAAPSSQEAAVVTAEVRALGLFAAGALVRDAGLVEDSGPSGGALDGGGVDAGAHNDRDAGRNDAGPPRQGPSFAFCDLTPTSCAGDERCMPDPFTPGVGRCLAPCSAELDDGDGGSTDASTIDADLASPCACCGSLPGQTGAFCLPAELCGEGRLGDGCPGGTSDCSPSHSDACADLGRGPVCTRACTAHSEAEACGDGCCLEGSRGQDVGLFCQAASECPALSLGTRCESDRACVSGRCSSHDGHSAPRCTTTCEPGTCDPGLCCMPESCAGEWLCVPEDVCVAQTSLLCEARCVSDAACGPDSACIDGACHALAPDACARHEHCRADAERCDLRVARAADGGPEGGGADAGSSDDAHVGTCVARSAGACFSDLHCPPPGSPEHTLCRKDASCGTDPTEQCAGTCAAPYDDECLHSDDCPSDKACIDHRCL